MFFQYYLLIIASFLGVNASQILAQTGSQQTISIYIFCIMAGIAYFPIYFIVFVLPEELTKLMGKKKK